MGTKPKTREMTYISYDLLKKYVEKAEEEIRLSKKYAKLVTLFYEFTNKRSFSVELAKDMQGSSLLSMYHTLQFPVAFFDVLMYAYMLPWPETVTEIPHFENEKEWHDWFYQHIRVKKRYYSVSNIKKNGHSYLGNVDLQEYAEIHKNELRYKALSIERIVNLLETDAIQWGVLSGGNEDSFSLGGPMLTDFPVFDKLSPAKQRPFLILDIGNALYETLQHVIVEGDEPPLIIPKEILDERIIGLTKQSVVPDVDYDSSSKNIELHSTTYHTVFDVVPMAAELSELDDDKERLQLIESVVRSIKEEKRSFFNVTAKDFAVLTNLIRMFYKNDRQPVLKTTLGELCDSALKGLLTEREQHNPRMQMVETLETIQKWSNYSFNIGRQGRVNLLSYTSGDIADAGVFAKKLESGEIKGSFTGNNTLMIGDNEQDEYDTMELESLKSVPINLELSRILLESMEHNYMSKQFEAMYSQIHNSNAKVIYSFIEHLRKTSGYPSHLTIKDSDFMKAFAKLHSYRLRQVVERTLEKELKPIGAIKDYRFNDAHQCFEIDF